MSKPLVSVVVPTFNRLQYLRAAIESVFAQTFVDWALIIADDGSDEETVSFLRSIERPPRIRLLRLSHTGIPAVVRNAGLCHVQTEYVAFLDADDLWHPTKLARQLAAMRSAANRAWCYTGFVRTDEEGTILADEPSRPWTAHEGQIFEQLVSGAASIRTPCVVARRDLIERVRGFDETLHSCEDYDLWMRLALLSDVAVVDEPLVQVRLNAGSFSNQEHSILLDRDRSLAKMMTLVEPRRRALLQRERARNAAVWARRHAGRGDRMRLLSVVARSLPYSWRYTRWWMAVLATLVRSVRI